MNAAKKPVAHPLFARARALRGLSLLLVAAWFAGCGSARAQNVYVGNFLDSTVDEYNLATGAAVSSIGANSVAGPIGLVLSGNTLYVANHLGSTLVALDANTGAHVAGFAPTLANANPWGLALAGNVLYVSFVYANLVEQYDATTGADLGPAQPTTGLNGPTGIALAGNNLYVSNFFGGTVGAYDLTTGAPTTGFTPIVSPNTSLGPTFLLVSGTHLYAGFAGYQSSPQANSGGMVVEYDLASGTPIASFTAISGLLYPTGMQIAGNTLYVADAGAGTVGSYNATTGGLLGSVTLPAGANGESTPYGIVFAGTVVPGTANPWLAPAGSTDSLGYDSVPADSPAVVAGLTLVSGSTLSFNVAGSENYAGYYPSDPPDGATGSFASHGAENGLSGVTAPFEGLVGVFINDSPADPTNANVLPSLDFSDPVNGVLDGIDYVHLDPGIGQVFFIGDGLTTSGIVQTVTVPAGATHLVLGPMDIQEWNDNSGAFTVTVNVAAGAPAAGGSLIVPGAADPWLAGRPDGVVASADADTAPAQSPVLVPNLTLDPNHGVLFSVGGAVTGGATSSVATTPDGGAFVTHNAENGLSTITAPVNSLVGVFLGPDEPLFSAVPPTLDYSDPTLFGTAKSAYAPRLEQVFFIGDGLDANGKPQVFYPPVGATRLYLGTMDNTVYNDNTGSFNVGVSISSVDASTLQASETVQSASEPTHGTFALEGDVLTYNFTVYNAGTAPDTNVVLTNVLPGYIDPTSVIFIGGAGSLIGNVITMPLGTIGAGDEATRAVQFTLSGAPLGREFTNGDYYATADGIANVSGTNAPATFIEDAVSVKVSTNAAAQRPGDLVSFTYDIANRTLTKFKKLTLTVPVPQGLIFSDVADNAYFVDSQGNHVTPAKSAVGYNSGGTVTFTVNALTDDADVFAVVQFQVPYDFNPAGLISAGGAQLVISKYTAGNPVTFAVDGDSTPLSGQGPEVEPSLLFVKSMATGDQAAAVLAFNPKLGTALTATALQSYLAANPNQKFVTGLGNFTDFSVLTSAQQTQVLNPYLGTDSDPDTDLAVSTLPAPSTKTPAPFVTFALGFVNYGAGKATAVVVSDTVPSGLALVPGSILLNGAPVAPSALTLSADGTSFSLVAKNLKTGAGGVILYRATVLDPNSGGLAVGSFIQPTSAQMTVSNVTSEFIAPPPDEILVTGPAHASVESSQSGRTAIGSNVTYTLFCQNDGGQTITDLQVVSPIPAGGAFVSATLLDTDQQPRQPNTAKGESLDTSDTGAGGRVVFHFGKVKPRGFGLAQVVYTMTPAILQLPEQALLHQAYVAATGGLTPTTSALGRFPVLRRALETTAADDPTSQVASAAGQNKTAPTNSPNGSNLGLTVNCPQSVVAGEEFTYTITALSLGNTSTGSVIGNPYLTDDPSVLVYVHLPANTAFVGADNLGFDNNIVFGPFPALKNGSASTVTVRLRATGAAGSTITNPDIYIKDGLTGFTLHSGPIVTTVIPASNVTTDTFRFSLANSLSASSKTTISGPDYTEKIDRVTTSSQFTVVIGADCVPLNNDVVIIPTTGGNYVVQGNASNIVAQGGGNIVAQGGGNIVAQGGGNIVAQGGGNFASIANLTGTGGASLIGSSGMAIGDIIASIVAQGGGNIVAQGGGNIVAQGGGNLQSVGFPAKIPDGFAATAVEKAVVTGQANLQSIASLNAAIQNDTFTSNNGSLTTLDAGHLIGNAGGALQIGAVEANTPDATTAQAINPSGSILRLGNGLIGEDGSGITGQNGHGIVSPLGHGAAGREGISPHRK